MAKNNANGVDEMLDMLYEMIDDAKAIPFSNDCRLDRNGALDLLDSIRNRFPVELNESIKIVQQREDYLARAQKEAQRVLEQAQAQAQRMVDEQEIVRQARSAAEEAVRTAKAKATEILTKATDDAKAVSDEAEERAASLKQAANEYCADALRRMEELLEGYSGSVRFVMQAYDDGKIHGGTVYGQISKLISVPEKYVTAIETALGANIQNIAVENEDVAKVTVDTGNGVKGTLRRTNKGTIVVEMVTSSKKTMESR